ncbi:MAG: transposase [Prochloraceae cyanobacterium]|nr:transposase [Prochloraceae cyanobacterium]
MKDCGKRRWVDPHWFRGNSYLKIGWDSIKTALTQVWKLFSTLRLSGFPDPETAKASRKQDRKKYWLEFTVKSFNYA